MEDWFFSELAKKLVEACVTVTEYFLDPYDLYPELRPCADLNEELTKRESRRWPSELFGEPLIPPGQVEPEGKEPEPKRAESDIVLVPLSGEEQVPQGAEQVPPESGTNIIYDSEGAEQVPPESGTNTISDSEGAESDIVFGIFGIPLSAEEQVPPESGTNTISDSEGAEQDQLSQTRYRWFGWFNSGKN